VEIKAKNINSNLLTNILKMHILLFQFHVFARKEKKKMNGNAIKVHIDQTQQAHQYTNHGIFLVCNAKS